MIKYLYLQLIKTHTMSTAVTLRKLTKKSTLKFGTYRNTTVETLIGMNKAMDLVSIYYNLSNITFVDEVLDELGITPEFRIEKPSKAPEKFKEFIEYSNYVKKRPSNQKVLLKMIKPTRVPTNGFLQSLNHGRCV